MFRPSLARAVPALRLAVRSTPSSTRFLSMAVRRSALAPVRANVVRSSGVCAARWYSSGALQKSEVEGRIMSLLQGFDKVNDPANITGTAHFSNDLGLDSLDTVEVVMAIEEEFSIEIPDKDADSIHSVDKAVEYILNQPDAN